MALHIFEVKEAATDCSLLRLGSCCLLNQTLLNVFVLIYTSTEILYFVKSGLY